MTKVRIDPVDGKDWSIIYHMKTASPGTWSRGIRLFYFKKNFASKYFLYSG
jgi:hypothetical protein